MKENKKYHYLRNGEKVTMTLKEAKIINESNTKESLEFDVQWYLSHGYVTSEGFERKHPIQ